MSHCLDLHYEFLKSGGFIYIRVIIRKLLLIEKYIFLLTNIHLGDTKWLFIVAENYIYYLNVMV